MNTKILKIAVNNVIKHKRRTLFNSLTFAANAMALILVIGMVNGMYNTMYERTIDLETGHFKIYHKDYAQEKKKTPIEKNIDDPSGLIKLLESIKHYESAAPRILNSGSLSNMENKTNIMIMGIDMEKELRTMKLFSKMKEEDMLAQSGAQMLLGGRLAELMGNDKGDSMLLFSRTASGANNLVDAAVKGVYRIGFAKMEKSLVFIPIEFARDFFDMQGKATEVVVKITDRKYLEQAKKEIQDILDEKFPALAVRDWKQEAAGLIAGAQADYITYGIIFAILLFLAVFIIMNTLTITVFERTKEIGTLRAFGLEKGQIRWMFLWEGLILSAGGAVIGGLLVIPLAVYMAQTGITIPPDMMDRMPFPVESMTSKHAAADWLLTFVICLAAGAAGAIMPANRAAKTVIVDALK